jgi:hypothetical protein
MVEDEVKSGRSNLNRTSNENSVIIGGPTSVIRQFPAIRNWDPAVPGWWADAIKNHLSCFQARGSQFTIVVLSL